VEMDKVPTSRDPWTVLQSVPSVQIDRINVGGSQSGQQSNYYAKGALGRDNTWNMDGVNITDMGATGSSPLYFDFDSFEEMQVTTGGSDPRISTPGIQLNMVTKRGTNDFKGSGRYLYTPGSYQADATVPSEASGYLSQTNAINFVRDYGGEIGGPVLRDRLWFWAARGDQKISNQASSTIGANGTVTTGLFDNIVLRNKNLKLNGQIFSSNSAVAYYTWGDKVRNARNLSPTRPFITAWRQVGPTTVYKLEDTQIIGSSLYLTGMWSKVQGGFGLFANGGAGESAPSAWRDASSVWHDNFETYETVRPQKQYRIDGSKFLDFGRVNNEFKFGFGYRNTPVDSFSSWPGPSHGTWRFDVVSAATCTGAGLPSNCAVANVPRDAPIGYTEKYNDFYIGDTVLLGNLTLQGGLRWDRQKTANTGLSIDANPILATPLNLPCTTAVCPPGETRNAALPPITYAGDPQQLKWNTVTPRIGATYALGADKRTLLRASYNRYASQVGSAVTGANPLNYSAFYFYGVDANNDHTIQRSELMKIRGFAGVDINNPSAVANTRRVDYGMKVPTTDEIILGGERQLLSDFSVGVNYTYRKSKDLYTTRFEKTQGKGDWYTSADYIPATKTINGVVTPVVAGGTFTLKDPITGQTITSFTTSTQPVWALAPNVPLPTYRVLTTRPGYTQNYNGLEVTATKRLSHNWMFRANATYGDYKEKCSGGAFANPTQVLNGDARGSSAASTGGPVRCQSGQVAPQSAGSGAFGNDFVSAKWSFNVTGVYIFPWDINLGANLNARQGYPAALRDQVTGLRGGTITVLLDPIGDVRFDNVYELDLRLAKDFRIMNRVGLTVSADLFNAPNKRTTLQRETLLFANEVSRAAAWRLTELQSPRVWRFGARINY
jgi:TonB-dependent receptor-like protein